MLILKCVSDGELFVSQEEDVRLSLVSTVFVCFGHHGPLSYRGEFAPVSCKYQLTCTEFLSSFFFLGILQGIFWGFGNGGGTMISGALIEVYGVINTFRAFALAGTAVLIILVISQYIAGLLEQRRQHGSYDMLSDSDESKSDGSEPKD